MTQSVIVPCLRECLIERLWDIAHQHPPHVSSPTYLHRPTITSHGIPTWVFSSRKTIRDVIERSMPFHLLPQSQWFRTTKKRKNSQPIEVKKERKRKEKKTLRKSQSKNERERNLRWWPSTKKIFQEKCLVKNGDCPTFNAPFHVSFRFVFFAIIVCEL